MPVGEKFGRLTLLREDSFRSLDNAVRYICICDCGKEVSVRGKSLRSGATKSCGCLERELHSLPYGEAYFNRVFYHYKKQANKRSLVFEILREDFISLILHNCYYCGSEPENKYYDGFPNTNGKPKCNGLDRLDNNKGYMLDNVVPCCKWCNRGKGDQSKEEYLRRIKRTYENLHLDLEIERHGLPEQA